jgi:ketosteroid isomerase-like protein
MSSQISEKTEKILQHHLSAIGEGNVDEVMSDYSEDAMLITPDGVLQGHDKIRPLFESFATEILPPGSQFEMVQQFVNGELAYIVWSADSSKYSIPIGTDTFIIRDGKITTQTLAAQMVAKNG